MDICVRPDGSYNHEPFMIRVSYNESVEKVIMTISLTLINAPIGKMTLKYNNKKLKNSMRLDQIGVSHGDTVELEESKSNCCSLL